MSSFSFWIVHIIITHTAFNYTPAEVLDLTNTLGANKAVENCTRYRLKCTHSFHTKEYNYI